MAAEIAAVPEATAELQGFSNYGAVFGITAPPADQLAGLLTIAAQWTSLLSESSAWLEYVKSEEGMAWKDALVLVEKMKPAFQLASSANPALVGQYPALARLLGASKVAAKRALATRKKGKATATAATAATPAGAGATAEQAATPGGSNGGTAAPAPAPARVVTVQG